MNNNVEQPKKDNTLKTVLIILGIVLGVIAVGVIGFILLFTMVFNKTLDFIEENSNEYSENHNSSSSEDEYGSTDDEEYDGEEIIIQDNYSNIEKISLSTLKEMIKKKRSFVIVISQTYCSHCIAYKPIYNEVLKSNKVKGYELDILTLSEDEYEEFKTILSISGTPTTLVYIDGVAQEEILEGNTTSEKLNDYLSKYGFI